MAKIRLARLRVNSRLIMPGPASALAITRIPTTDNQQQDAVSSKERGIL